ncbi:hypothetical protein MCOR25_005085 [Pyricularia grisea]|nr:hypothetical protein MCOR25_005085 [Pyricularia grisea]
MEPPSKKPRLSHSLDQDGDELDLNIEDLALDRQFQRSTYRSAFSFKSTLENIFEKYGRDFGDEGDEIDLNTGKITVDRGHFRGIFGGNLPVVAVGDDCTDVAGQGDEEGEEEGDDEDGIDLNQLYSDGEEEDDGEDEHEEGSIDLEADGEDDEEPSHIPSSDAIPDLPDIPEPPQLPPSFSALESSVNGGLSKSGTLLGTLNRLLTMAAASRSASDPSFDPLSVTNELVEPAWRVPALPPSLLQKKSTAPVKTKSSAATKSIVRKPRPIFTHDTDSEDEITKRASHIGPERTPLNQRNASPYESETRSATSPETSGCIERVPNQESHTRSTSRPGKSKHREAHSATVPRSPPPTEDERDVTESQCMETGYPQRPLKRKHESIVIHIIDERLQKLEQSKLSLLNAPVETLEPVSQGAPIRDESVIESGSAALENPESPSRPREFTNKELLETDTESDEQTSGQASTVEETTMLSPRLPSGGNKGQPKKTEAPPETFTKNYVDPSYGFSDEEDGGWVPAPKAAGRGRRRGPLILRPRSVSPELDSPPRPTRSPLGMPEPVATSADVTLSSQSPSFTALIAEAEPQPEHALVEDLEHENTPPAAFEDEELSMLVDNQPPEPAPVQESTIVSPVAVEDGEASQSPESSGLRRPVDEPVLEEYFRPANEQHVEPVSEPDLEVVQHASADSSLGQLEVSHRQSVIPQDQTSHKSSPQSLPTQLGDQLASGKQGSAYLRRRTRRQWPPESNLVDKSLSTQDSRPATRSPPLTSTPSRRSVRSVGSLLSLVNDGSDEDELSTYFTPRTRSVASSGGYAGPARISRETLSSPIKKKTPKSLSRRLFMTKASSSVHAKPKASSFSLVSGAQFHTTPLSHRGRATGSGSSSVRSRVNSSPVRSVIQTPGGSKRRCGEEGFRCDRDWCFFCIGDQQ